MVKKLNLSSAEITGRRDIGFGDVCYIELESGYECKLVSPISRCLFLLYGKEVGPVAQYILTAENETNHLSETNYLSELEKGSKILSVNCEGEVEQAIVKENIVKRMECVLINAKCKEIVDNDNLPYYNPKNVNLFIQKSDESWLVKKDGKPISLQELSVGTEVLVYLGLYGYGRHFGVGVENIKLLEK